MSDQFQESYVNDTNPSPYHLVVMQSQKMINDAFWNMWVITNDDSDDDTDPADDNDYDVETASRLHWLSFGIFPGAYIDAYLKAPEIIVHVTSGSPQLYYLVSFESAVLRVNTNTDMKNLEDKEFDITDWVFAFPVTIGSQRLAKDDEKAAKYLRDMGNPVGNFSLAQLFLDTSQTTSWEPSLSDFCGQVWTDETTTVQENFQRFVQGWIDQMTRQKANIIGISLVTQDPQSVNATAPSFPPTSCDYAPYPYRTPGTNDPPKDGDESNAIAMLLMTRNVPPPSTVRIPRGPFVNSTDSHKGTLCMNVTDIWNRWFLPILQCVNFFTQIYPVKADVSTKDGFRPRCYIGYNPDHPKQSDSYYGFSLYPRPPLDLPFPTFWSWHGDEISSEAEDGDWWYKITVKETARSSSMVSFQSGGQRIQITGFTNFTVKVYLTGVSTGPSKTESSMTFYINWYLNFDLGVVSDGGLSIAKAEDGKPPCTTTYTAENDGVDWEGDWSTYAQYVADFINRLFEKYLGSMCNSLERDLASQHKLFLPFGGVFIVENALFNFRGDLMASLSYNGAPAPGVSPQPPEYLKKLPARPPLREVVPYPVPTEPVAGPLFKFPAFSDEFIRRNRDGMPA